MDKDHLIDSCTLQLLSFTNYLSTKEDCMLFFWFFGFDYKREILAKSGAAL